VPILLQKVFSSSERATLIQDQALMCNVDSKVHSSRFDDVERLNVNMVRGAVRMGAYIPSQLGINRPHPLLSGTRTPIEDLYLCGSSTGNGGGINGAPGYIAANAIMDDLGLDRPWTRVPPAEWKH
jgi:phytoene dehydrogenase-like protein